MVKGDHPTEDRSLPYGQADTVPVLEPERGLFIWESEFLRLGPDRHDVGGRRAGLDQRNGGVDQFATLRVRVTLRHRRAAHRKRPVVASAVSVVTVQYVEERGITGANESIAKDVRVR